MAQVFPSRASRAVEGRLNGSSPGSISASSAISQVIHRLARRPKPVLTVPELDARRRTFLVEEYNQRAHSETGIAPQACWEARSIGPYYGLPGEGKTVSARQYARWNQLEALLGGPPRTVTHQCRRVLVDPGKQCCTRPA
jgi:hypothetical protein